MDFDFTDDQEQLRDAVRRWVDKGFSFERRHEITKAGGHTRALLGELTELGLLGLQVGEAQGGLGFGPVEAMVVMEELGRGLVNAPYAQAALIAPALLARAPEALQAAWLPRIVSGEALVVLAHQERAARYRLCHVTTRARQTADGWLLDGAKGLVPAGDEADAFIVPARHAGADEVALPAGLERLADKGQGVGAGGQHHQFGVALLDLAAADLQQAGDVQALLAALLGR